MFPRVGLSTRGFFIKIFIMKIDKTLSIILISVIIIFISVGIYYLFFINKNINNQIKMENKTLENNLQIIDEVIGTGDEAKAGGIVSVNYIGTLVDGKKFDSSYDRGQPFSFVLGVGQVIRGWEEGIVGMRVGGKRKLVISPNFAYGNQEVGNGLIPANSTLIFEVELLEVQSQ